MVSYGEGSCLTSTVTRFALMVMVSVKRTVALGSKGSIPESTLMIPDPAKVLPFLATVTFSAMRPTMVVSSYSFAPT